MADFDVGKHIEQFGDEEKSFDVGKHIDQFGDQDTSLDFGKHIEQFADQEQPLQPSVPDINPPEVVQQTESALPTPEVEIGGGLEYSGLYDDFDASDRSGLGRTRSDAYSISRDDDKVSKIVKWMGARYPNKPLPKDNLGIVKSFQETLAKTDADYVRDMTWALNATEEQKAIAREVEPIADELPTTVSNEFWAAIKSPTTYTTGGAGLVAKKYFAKKLGATLAARAATVGATAAAEAVPTAAKTLTSQKTREELGLMEGVSDTEKYAELAISIGIGTVFGAAEGVAIAKTLKNPKLEIKSLVERKRKTPEQLRENEQEFLKKFEEREKNAALEPLFEDSAARKKARRETLDVMDEPKEVTEAVLNEDNIKNIYATAKQLFKDNPELIPDNPNTKRITQVIIDALNTADVDTLQQAAARAGVDNTQFLDAFKVSLSQAGSVMQGASDMSRFLARMTKGVDPELDRIFERMSKAGDNQIYLSGSVISGVRKVTDASVATAVAGLSTTMLNALGLAGAMTIGTAVDTVESVFKHTGRMVSDLRGDVPLPVKGKLVKQRTEDMMKDSFRAMATVFDSGESNKIYELVMKYNPRLDGMLLQSAQEADKLVGGGNKAFDAMNKTVNTLNMFNRAVESFVRKPMLVYNLRKRMDELGLDFEDFVANDKAIPAAIIKDAVDDTLNLTFSSGFKKTGEKSFEGYSESAAATLVSVINNNDLLKIGANVEEPFFRFMLNSVRYSYRLTPGSGWAGIKEFGKATNLLKQAKDLEAKGYKTDAKLFRADAAGLAYTGRRKMIEAAVGTGAIAMAMIDLKENADLPLGYKRDPKTGEIYDYRPFAPVSFVYAMGALGNYLEAVGTEFLYTATMTEKERAQEAQKVRKKANSLAVTDSRRNELLVKAELLGGRLRDFDGVTFMEMIAGTGRTSVSRDTIFDKIKTLTEEGIKSSKIAADAGTKTGEFLDRFDNFLNPVYEMTNIINEDYRVVESKGDIEFETVGDIIEGVGLDREGPVADFSNAMVAALAKSIPVARDSLPDKPSLFQPETPQVPVGMRYLAGGQRPTPPTTKIENELLDLGIEPYKIFKNTGNRTIDNIRVELAREPMIATLNALIESDEYVNLRDSGKRKRINDAIAFIYNQVKEGAEEIYVQRQSIAKEIDRRYSKMPKIDREAAEDIFFDIEERRPTTPQDKAAILEGRYSLK